MSQPLPIERLTTWLDETSKDQWQRARGAPAGTPAARAGLATPEPPPALVLVRY